LLAKSVNRPPQKFYDKKDTNDMKITTILAASAALTLLSGCGGDGTGNATGNATSTSAAVAAPKGTVWTETVVATPEGGFRMGNPNAPVKLIEYGALSCPHCREFAEKSTPELKALVDKGTVSFEFRTFLLGPQDLPLAVLARCGGAGPFFPIAEQMYVNQASLMDALHNLTPDEQKGMAAMQPIGVTKFLADKMGVVAFVQQRGISAEKANACLANPKTFTDLEKLTQVGIKDFKVEGTPTFVLNGVTIKDFSDTEELWVQLKRRLIGAGG
jgi:protein-disulfide isomerase